MHRLGRARRRTEGESGSGGELCQKQEKPRESLKNRLLDDAGLFLDEIPLTEQDRRILEENKKRGRICK